MHAVGAEPASRQHSLGKDFLIGPAEHTAKVLREDLGASQEEPHGNRVRRPSSGPAAGAQKLLPASGRCDGLVKVLLVGDVGAGKTCLLQRFVEDTFHEKAQQPAATLGIDWKLRQLDILGVRLNLQLWEAGGCKQLRDITQQFYERVHAILFVYSVQSRNSFDSILQWYEDATSHAPAGTSTLLVGNQCDAEASDRVVSCEEGQQLATSLGTEFAETSARSGEYVEAAFTRLVYQIVTPIISEEGDAEFTTMGEASSTWSGGDKGRSCSRETLIAPLRRSLQLALSHDSFGGWGALAPLEQALLEQNNPLIGLSVGGPVLGLTRGGVLFGNLEHLQPRGARFAEKEGSEKEDDDAHEKGKTEGGVVRAPPQTADPWFF